MGLSNAFLWNVAAAIWLLLGSVQIISWAFKLTAHPLTPATVIVTGVIPLIASGIFFLAGRRNVAIDPWFHAPLALGLVVIIGGSLLDVENRGAHVVYPMLPMICALVLFPLRSAWPYVIGALIGSCEEIFLSNGADPGARGAVTVTLIFAIAGVLAVGQAQLHDSLRRSRELAEVDPLTGVANVRALVQHMRHEFSRPLRSGSTVGLIVFDLDDFKRVNDEFGHSTGDKVLIAVAEAVRGLLQPGDLIARRGGDEFTVAAIDRPDRSLQRLVQKIAMTVESTRAELVPSVDPHASIGFVLRRSGEELEAMFDRADSQLHESKLVSHARRGGPRTEQPERRLIPRVQGDRRAAGLRRAPGAAEHAQTTGDQSRMRTGWQLTGICFATFAALVPLLAFADKDRGLMTLAAFVTAALAAAGAVFCFTVAGRNESSTALRAAIALAFGVAAMVVLSAGPERAAVLELVVLPTLLAFYVAGSRAGLACAAAAFVFYAWAMSTVHYELAAIRVIQTAVVIVIAGLLVPRVLKRAHETDARNQQLSGVDAVTSIANVRRLNQRLEDELARTRVVGGYVTVMMIDLDDFKQVNDKYSHKHGDRTLAAVAAAIERVVGPQDLAARRGGDEFVVVLPHDGEIEPEKIAETLAAEIRAAREEICPDLNSDASIGFVTSRAGDTVEALIERGDEQEQVAKQDHRAVVARGHLRSVA